MKVVNILRQIIQGYWYLLVKKDKKIEKIASFRAKICNSCPEKGKYSILSLEIPKCNSCGCVLAAKQRSEEASCPKSKW